MNNFDSLFFRGYIGADSEIKQVFHRHIFVIIEDILLWTLFGLVIPAFLYANDLFSLRTSLGSELYAYGYIFLIYGILMYKLFDWYVDVWIATENTIVDMKWRWFSSDILYIPYNKIEWVEIRTRSWWAALLGISDVIVKLAGGDQFTLYSARNPSEIIAYIQETAKKKWHSLEGDEREPFDILVDTLSDVVKWHLTTRGKEYITSDYVEKLDETLIRGKPIDLRTPEEKVVIEWWKSKYKKKKEEWHDEKHDDSASDHDDHHGH